jgi:hypothetical protein
MYSLCGGNPMNFGRDYKFRSSPEECLDSAISYLVDKSYRIESRTEAEVSMFRRSITPDWVLVILIVSLFTFGVPLLGLLVLFFYKRRIIVVARPLRGGASLATVSWSNENAKRSLEAWIEVEWRDNASPWRPGTSRWRYSPRRTVPPVPPLDSDYVPACLNTKKTTAWPPPRSRASLVDTTMYLMPEAIRSVKASEM